MRNLVLLGQHDLFLLHSGKSTLPDEDLSGFQVESELQVALDRWKPDAVIISNPTALHMQVALPAAEAGCHLLLEKPVSNTLEPLRDLHKILRKTGKSCLVGFQFRFHPGLVQLKKLLEEVPLGTPPAPGLAGVNISPTGILGRIIVGLIALGRNWGEAYFSRSAIPSIICGGFLVM